MPRPRLRAHRGRQRGLDRELFPKVSRPPNSLCSPQNAVYKIRHFALLFERIKNVLQDESGQDLVEYALPLVFLALAAIAVLPQLGSSINRVFSQSNSALTGS